MKITSSNALLRTLVYLAVVSSFACVAQAANYRFESIVDTQGEFTALSEDVAINRNGVVLFYGSIDGQTLGLYSASMNSVTTIVEASPLTLLFAGTQNDDAVVATVEATVSRVLMVLHEDGEPTTLLNTATGQFAEFGVPLINNNNEVVFLGTLDTSEKGVFVYDASGVRTVLLYSELGQLGNEVASGDFNNEGVMALLTSQIDFPQLGALKTTERIVVIDRDGARRQIGEAVTVVPGNDVASSFSSPVLTDDGMTTYLETSVDRQTFQTTYKLWQGDSAESLTRVWMTMPAPPANPLESLGKVYPDERIAANTSGVVAFYGTVTHNLIDGPRRGIFLGLNAETDTVIKEGDPLFGSTLVEIGDDSLFGSFMNELGQIVFHYKLENGVSGIAVASPGGPPSFSAELVRNAASGLPGALAPESWVDLYGENLAFEFVLDESLPTSLNGTSVTIIDSAGIQYTVRIRFLAANVFGTLDRIQVLIPAIENYGPATLRVVNAFGEGEAAIEIGALAPGLFAANENGEGPAAAVYELYNGVPALVSSGLTFTAVPVGQRENAHLLLGSASDGLYVSFYGTGFRNHTTFTCTADGVAVPVTGAVAHSVYHGLDQAVCGPFPKSLAGRPNAVMILTFDGTPANPVTLSFQ